jgi:hypothetical protein
MCVYIEYKQMIKAVHARTGKRENASEQASRVTIEYISLSLSRDIEEFYLSNVIDGNFKREKNEMHIYLLI